MHKNVIVTGGLGFIGSNFLNKYVLLFPEYNFLNIDAEKYAGLQSNIKSSTWTAKNYSFLKANLAELNEYPISWADFDIVINFAALSHVGNSIDNSGGFIDVNIKGVYHILEALRYVKNKYGKTIRLSHVSTDEVFGDFSDRETFSSGDTEDTRYRPTNPYAATKGASDLLIYAYHKTYGLNTAITNCCNNYGPNQHDEKLVPRVLYNLIHGKPITIHGDGSQVRDWIHVIDHGDAVWTVANNAAPGSQFNVSGRKHWTNLEIVTILHNYLSKVMEIPALETYLQFVSDRGYNDRKYYVNDDYLRKTLGWEPKIPFDVGMKDTVAHYINKWKK